MIREEKKPIQPRRWIVHVDVDAFFASVEQAIRPELKGKPVIVGGTPEVRGCVCSASYEARAVGIQTGMSLRQAQKLCPEAVFLPGCYAHYERFSKKLGRLLGSFTPQVETASIDDIYLDMTGCQRLHGDIEKTATTMQNMILQSLGLPVSMGVASNKVIARIASGLHKPRGLLIVPHGRERSFLDPLPLSTLPGIGRSTERRLNELGIGTIGELAVLPRALLVRTFGLPGGLIHDRAQGLDDRDIIRKRNSKSISRETTFKEDTIDRLFIHSVLKYLCERVGMTLRRLDRQCRTMTMKIRFGDFQGVVRSRTFPSPSDDNAVLFREAVNLYTKLHTRKVAIRLIGVAISNFVCINRQEDFLDAGAGRRDSVNTGMDSIREKYGFNVIDYGDTMKLRQCYAEDEDGLVLKTPSLSR
jgi:DNA polymerase-4